MNDARILRDILRVDHAGELGAIRIYEAQRRIARRRAPDLVAMLDAALADERRHCAAFRAAMGARAIVPCHLLGLWWIGGSLLGMITALMGRGAIMVCTEAVETAVHRHMTEQIGWLELREPELAVRLAAIRAEEFEHIERSRAHSARRSRVLFALVSSATNALVWIATYGAAGRLSRAMVRASCHAGPRAT